MKRFALIGAAVALAAGAATPASAAPTLSSPAGFVTASDGLTSGSCAYTRTAPWEWGDAIDLYGVATSVPDGSVEITCTVISRVGSLTAHGSGVLAATANGWAVLPDGATTVCITIVGQHTIDVRDEASACRTFGTIG